MKRRAGWLRAALVAYLGVTVVTGVWAEGWPRSFYHDFPWPGHAWVAPLPVYNEHLVGDFGGMNLAMAVVFAAAAISLDRRLAITALVAYLVFALPHLVFHLDHLEPFGAADAAGQVVSLVAAAALPLLALVGLTHACMVALSPQILSGMCLDAINPSLLLRGLATSGTRHRERRRSMCSVLVAAARRPMAG